MQALPAMLYLWRSYNRLTQRDAADIMNVHLNTWSRWERGLTRPTEDQMSNIDYYTMHDPKFRFPPKGGDR